MFDKLTIKAQEALESAAKLAQKYNHPQIDPEHFLLGLLSQKEGIISPLLTRVGAEPSLVYNEMEKLLQAKPRAYGDTLQVPLSSGGKALLDKKRRAI